MTKAVSPIGKKMTFGSVVQVRVRVRFRKVVVTVRVKSDLQEINVRLCDVPKSDLRQQMCVCGL